ncbi:MAG: Dam family site-specific DNA-(adenine-N6)-methyltransferase [Ruminococcus sp.]|uniref:DNA adenine methylase n=1 Tax=Ruminococcus sp. TaxID=41978 RepID=UPI0025DFD927|nr:Dam family site-specific DNA-(adenine-N6)-methyltransferase [Ruminococcus sp.]MCR5540687.1 Dam family site-specific DNA-(adenine-N6)-methyltransferase [Ruminococcus sp.]
MRPFLKWPGGKQWLISKYSYIFPKQFNLYIEPFLGGGSVFFHLLPEKAIIADVNNDLINTYQVMARNPKKLKSLLELHQDNHCKEYYYIIRNTLPNNRIDRAARFLYLNRTCYNGMYRVNKDGLFNVPIGTKNNFIYDVDNFIEYGESLRNIHILTQDFVSTIHNAEMGDLIFADPPYAISDNQSGFIKYNDKLFSWKDQKRLLKSLIKARDRGANIVLTNEYNHQIQEMYQQNGFFTHTLKRYSSISGNSDGRGQKLELLVLSYHVDFKL